MRVAMPTLGSIGEMRCATVTLPATVLTARVMGLLGPNWTTPMIALATARRRALMIVRTVMKGALLCARDEDADDMTLPCFPSLLHGTVVHRA